MKTNAGIKKIPWHWQNLYPLLPIKRCTTTTLMGKEYATPQATSNATTVSKPFFGPVQRQPSAITATPAKDPLATTDLAKPEQEHELRTALGKLFDEFEHAGVGDEKFNAIITEESWKEKKKNEAEYKKKKAAYDEAMKTYDPSKGGKAPEKPDFVATYTTCIDTQRVLLQKAFEATGMSIKKVGQYNEQLKLKKNSKKAVTYGYGSTGQVQGQEIGAWHTAKPNDPERPKMGDIIVLASRGKSVDKAADLVQYSKTLGAKQLLSKPAKEKAFAENNVATLTKALEDAEAARQALIEVEGTGSSNAVKAAELKVKKAADALQKARKAAEDAAAAFQKATDKSNTTIADSEQKLDAARAGVDHQKFYEFSHVAFIKSITSNGDGTETWVTFDGGQTMHVGKDEKQGARFTHRRYDPRINEITGEASQGGLVRWLQGWIDVTKLVETSADVYDEAAGR